jgi:thioesterase domain-containing protein
LVVRSAASADEGMPPDLGWGRVCRGALRTLDVPGSHMDVLREPAVALIAEALAPRHPVGTRR